MTGRAFVDTNVVVYAYELKASDRQATARSLLCQGLAQETAVLSTQVLSEFYVVVTRKSADPLTPEQARRAVDALAPMLAVGQDLTLVRRAIDAHTEYGLSYWDGLIVAAAERARCQRLLSEDLNPGQRYFGIPVENPFA